MHLSISYKREVSEKNIRCNSNAAAGATAGTKTTGMEQKSIQLAYTIGGATIGIARC